MIIRCMAPLAILAFCAVPAFAADDAAPAGAEAAETSADEARQEKKICRTEAVTGYRARRSRVCMTKRQWEALADGSRRGANEYITDQNRVPPASPGA